MNSNGSSKEWTGRLLLGAKHPTKTSLSAAKRMCARFKMTWSLVSNMGRPLPSGLSSGHQISLVIDRETLAYSAVKSFDDLPIPFRCVSTELISGKAHVFSSGPIGLAMRSSMSLPGIFAPVRDGDRLYVDGALVDNLPTDLARQMGPDVVIAIHLQVAPATADEIQSLFSVLGRSITVGTAATEFRGMEAADIVVKVDVQKFTSLDFDKAEALIQKGMQAAEEKAKIFCLMLSIRPLGTNTWLSAMLVRKEPWAFHNL